MTQSERKRWRRLDYLAFITANILLAAGFVVWLIVTIIPGETPADVQFAILAAACCTAAIGYWASKQPEWPVWLTLLVVLGSLVVAALGVIFDGDGIWLREALSPLPFVVVGNWLLYLTRRPKRALLLLFTLCILACVACVVLATNGGLIPQLMFGHESQGLAVLVWMWLSFVPLALIAVVLAVAERISSNDRSSKS